MHFWDFVDLETDGAWIIRTDDGHNHHLYLRNLGNKRSTIKSFAYEYEENTGEHADDLWTRSFGLIVARPLTRIAYLKSNQLEDHTSTTSLFFDNLGDYPRSPTFFSNLSSLFFDDIETRYDVLLSDLILALHPNFKSPLYVLQA